MFVISFFDKTLRSPFGRDDVTEGACYQLATETVYAVALRDARSPSAKKATASPACAVSGGIAANP